jgi:hypothetical protein
MRQDMVVRRMAKRTAALALLATVTVWALPAQAATGEMTVAAFLGKYEALKKKGLAALTSPDVKLLKAEGEAAGQAYLARMRADRAAGRPPHSCGPAKARIGQGEFIAGVQKYPVTLRDQITLKMAVADMMRKKYPC